MNLLYKLTSIFGFSVGVFWVSCNLSDSVCLDLSLCDFRMGGVGVARVARVECVGACGACGVCALLQLCWMWVYAYTKL